MCTDRRYRNPGRLPDINRKPWRGCDLQTRLCKCGVVPPSLLDRLMVVRFEGSGLRARDCTNTMSIMLELLSIVCFRR